MEHATLTVIREEHAALAAMLRTLTMLLAEHRRRGTLPDFAVLRAMIFYIDEFPERLHHTKETALLFPRLRWRSDEANGLLDRLDREHAHGEAKSRELAQALLAFDVMGESRRAAFESAATRYVDFYLAHMSTEEREILPLAERVLLPEGLGGTRRGFRPEPRPADRTRAGARIRSAVPPHRVHGAGAARPCLMPTHRRAGPNRLRRTVFGARVHAATRPSQRRAFSPRNAARVAGLKAALSMLPAGSSSMIENG